MQKLALGLRYASGNKLNEFYSLILISLESKQQEIPVRNSANI